MNKKEYRRLKLILVSGALTLLMILFFTSLSPRAQAAGRIPTGLQD